MKRSKAYRNADAKIDKDALYSPAEAVKLAKETSPTKFDATVEVGSAAGRGPAQGGPDGPWHGQPAARHR